jgi:hypothetical protein
MANWGSVSLLVNSPRELVQENPSTPQRGRGGHFEKIDEITAEFPAILNSPASASRARLRLASLRSLRLLTEIDAVITSRIVGILTAGWLPARHTEG